MTNAELGRQLAQLAALSELAGENPFKARAYRKAARTVLELDQQVEDLLAHGADLMQLPGIGKEIDEKLRVMVETGSLPQLAELAETVPLGLIDVTEVPGVGPKSASTLWKELGVTGVASLEAAAKEGRIASLAGFGVKSQDKILAGIEAFRRHQGRMRLGDADGVVLPLLARVRAVPTVARVEVTGSYRRRRETIGDVDLLVVAGAEGATAAGEALTSFGEVDEVLGAGDTKTSVRLRSGLQVDLRVVEDASFGAAMLYFTGSKDHNVALRGRAVDAGWHLNEYGLFEGGEPGKDRAGGKRIAGATEEEVYQAFGLSWIPPELREDRGEIEAAAAGTLPALITLDDVRGDLHMHSTWSDGKSSVADMRAACAARGYEYMALTDHSQALRMTGGLDAAKLTRQWIELDALLGETRAPSAGDDLGSADDAVTPASAEDAVASTRSENAVAPAPAEDTSAKGTRGARHTGHANSDLRDARDLPVLRGLEVDILRDGSLDLDEDWLQRLDIVIVSVHSLFDLSLAEQTERVVRAVSHPKVNILAHPTGRLLGERDPYDIDLDAVFDACLANGVAVEHNASPHRLDLMDTQLMAARRKGLTIVINTDAHHVRQLDVMRFGVDQARRAWLESEAVLNTWPLARVRGFLRKEPAD